MYILVIKIFIAISEIFQREVADISSQVFHFVAIADDHNNSGAAHCPKNDWQKYHNWLHL